MPVKKAKFQDLPDSPERNPPQPENIMQRPKPKFRPKKVSPTEPPSLDYGLFAEVDGVPHCVSDNQETPLQELALKQPKTKKKMNKKVVKVLTEEMVIPTDSDHAEDEDSYKQKKKKRAANLPPVDILFAHLNRVDNLKSKVASKNDRPGKRSVTFNL